MNGLFPDFHNAKVAIVGDIMLDRFFHGDATRISPEAPVPVVHVTGVEDLPGGAANVAVNIASLGAQAVLCGAVGKDDDAEKLGKSLRSIGIDCGFHFSPIGTIVKSRIVSNRQQLLRMDFETRYPDEEWRQLLPIVEEKVADAQVLLLSDYNKGTLLDPQALIRLAKKNDIPVLIDPKGDNFEKYKGADCLTPNLAELQNIVGRVDSEAELETKAQNLMHDLELGALLVTRSEKGMSLFRPDQPELHLPAITREVSDVTGAGDTVIATLAAALAAGTDMETAVMLSNVAASVVVGRPGTSAISAPELQLEFHRHHDNRGFMSTEQLQLMVELAKKRGEKIVFTNGCFDILHAGHVVYLQQARALGDRLVVAINSDESVKKLKGEGRPINTVDRRLAVLAGLEMVDWVTSFEGDTPEDLLRKLKPDVLVKGGDYTKDQVVGKEIVESYGGEVKVMSLVDNCSTTDIVNRIRS